MPPTREIRLGLCVAFLLLAVVMALALCGTGPGGLRLKSVGLQLHAAISKQSPRKSTLSFKLHEPENCPAWIKEYASFHRQHRGQPGTKYLVWSAYPRDRGLGDRIRGMMYLTRQAAATGRVVLFTWRNEPHELEQYLPPAAINWSLTGIEGYEYPDFSFFRGETANTVVKRLLPGIQQHEAQQTVNGSSSRVGANKSSVTNITVGSNSSHAGVVALRVMGPVGNDVAMRSYITKGGLHNLTQHKFITVSTNQDLTIPCTACPTVAGAYPKPTIHKNGTSSVDLSAACLFQQLFALSKDVQDLAQQQLEHLYGRQAQQEGFQYLAVHMRLGGMKNEADALYDRGSGSGGMMDLVQGIDCVRRLGAQVGIDARQVPVLLITDHQELRKYIKRGWLANVVTSDVTPSHLAYIKKNEAADTKAAVSSYIDLALLARARCVVYSSSGFSATAWMMRGRKDCYDTFQGGLKHCLQGSTPK